MKDFCVQDHSAGVLRDWCQLTESPLWGWSSGPPSWWQDDVLPRILTLATQFSEAVFRSRTFLFKADNHNWRTFTWSSLLPFIAASSSVEHWFKYRGNYWRKWIKKVFSCFYERVTRFFENVRGLFLFRVSSLRADRRLEVVVLSQYRGHDWPPPGPEDGGWAVIQKLCLCHYWVTC